MDSSRLKDKVFEEIRLIPNDRLAELYDFIHFFRIGLESQNRSKDEQFMEFAGCWNDMTTKEFQEFSYEIADRRKSSFSRRRKQ